LSTDVKFGGKHESAEFLDMKHLEPLCVIFVTFGLVGFSACTLCLFLCDRQALAEAIQSVTEMNQDLAVEKIEIETATDLEVNGPK